jgi:IMP cyclohydrolase
MVEGLEEMARMDYPGRLIIMSRDISGDCDVVGYGLTGRSSSSQARKLVLSEDKTKIFVEPTNYEQMLKDYKSGKVGANPDLLIYLAIEIRNDCIAVSNGKQTSDISFWMRSRDSPKEVLERALTKWTYEPDAPNNTPRIAGVFTKNRAALAIIRRKKDGTEFRNYYRYDFKPGEGRLIATYTGVNLDPLPSFHFDPLEVRLAGKTPEEVCNNIYDALAPKKALDFRIAVATVFQNRKDFSNVIYVKNRHE